MSKNKLRQHNEWFAPLKKDKCPTCKCGGKRNPVEVYAWGEYHIGKWRTVKHFCSACFAAEVVEPLMNHADDCGCVINLVPRSGYQLPNWIRLPPIKQCQSKLMEAVGT